MRALVALLLSLSLLACPPKKPTVESGDAAEVTTSGDAAAAIVPTPIARDPITDCPNEPAWMAWVPCRAAGALYVVGKAPGVTPLARNTAANRGRAELVRLGLGEKLDDGRVVLNDTEAFDTFACKDQTYALVRVTTENDEVEVELTNCEGVAFEPEEDPDAACPVWTRRVAWRVGESVVAVGAVSGVKNRALAARTAKHRAAAEAQKVHAIALKVGDKTISSTARSGVAGLPTDPEMAECDGTLYTKVTFTKPMAE